MRNLIIFLLYFVTCAVFVLPVASRIRRQNGLLDERVWGRADSVEEDNRTGAEATTKRQTEEEIRKSLEVCQPYNPKVPDFRKVGRRVSEVKCEEYKWDIQRRNDVIYRERECYWMTLMRQGIFPAGDVLRGRPANRGEYPHMGAVGWKAAEGTWVFKCGASLISHNFVLTAGHCTKVSERDNTVVDPIPKIVRLGDVNIIDNPGTFDGHAVDRIISRIIKHPHYNSPVKYNDIALMELESPVDFDVFIHPACLYPARNLTELSKSAMVTGWGVIETVNRTISPNLQTAEVDFIDQELCDSQLKKQGCNRNWCGLRRSQLCAGKSKGGIDACQGDSGGPLQVNMGLFYLTQDVMHYVVGVTSFGYGCGLPDTPGVYTRVHSFIDWIEQHVWGKHGVQRESDA